MSADIQRNEKSFLVTQGGGLRCLDKIHKKEIIIMSTPHISAEKGDFAKTVLMPGVAFYAVIYSVLQNSFR